MSIKVVNPSDGNAFVRPAENVSIPSNIQGGVKAAISSLQRISSGLYKDSLKPRASEPLHFQLSESRGNTIFSDKADNAKQLSPSTGTKTCYTTDDSTDTK